MDLRPTTQADLAAIVALEAASYPADEAASAETLASRLSVAAPYFMTMVVDGCDDDGGVAGFICGTRCETFTAAAMQTHAPRGPVLAIHSVVVAPAYRRRGLAARALRWYRDAHAYEDGVRVVKLIAKAALLPLYVAAGFRVDGPSAIQHGRDAWFECSASGVDMVQMDAFADRVFGGNPAAVTFAHKSDAWMAAVAIENNLSETAFLQRLKPSTYAIRWFTPGGEVDLCGHATLAAAAALYETRREPDDADVVFQTRNAGSLKVSKAKRFNDDDVEHATNCQDKAWLSMDFPTSALTETTCDVPQPLLDALGVSTTNGGERQNGDAAGTNGSARALVFAAKGPPTVPDWFFHLDGVDSLEAAAFDIDAFARDDLQIERGVLVTCASNRDGVDFESRFFAPKLGVREDPVTGSAHTLLTAYWEARLGRDRPLVAHQASKRGGRLRVHTEGDRTIIQGQAAFVFDARLFAHPDDL